LKQLELLVQLIDHALTSIESGRLPDLLDAQCAVYGIAQGAIPPRSPADEKVLLLCEYCLDCLSHGERDRERDAAQVLRVLRSGFLACLARDIPAAEVRSLVSVSA
jgi:hypothetical protein